MGFHTGPEYFSLPVADQTWIIKDVLPVGGMLNIYGKPKTGKSMLALQLASSISSGKKEWMSFGVPTPVRVGYLQVDTPRSLWVERVKHLRDFGLDFSNVLFADADSSLYPFDILGEGKHWLKKNWEMLEPRPPVLIIDTLREMHSGSEDESAQMKNVIAELQNAVPGTALILISHSRKGNPQNFGLPADLMDENRGSGYVAGRMDCVMWLRERSLIAKGRALPETDIAVEMQGDSHEIVMTDKFLKDAVGVATAGGRVGSKPEDLAKALHFSHPKKSLDDCLAAIRRLAIAPATFERRPDIR